MMKNYDAWKTESPPQTESKHRTEIEVFINVDFTRVDCDGPDVIAKHLTAVLADALQSRMGLDSSDFDVEINSATQEIED
jgi:hypothetical protein